MDWQIIWFVLLAACANIMGGCIVFLKRNWTPRHLYSLMALSAGLLLAISILDLIPEAMKRSPESSLFILLGLLLIFFLQQFLYQHGHFATEPHISNQNKGTAWGAFGGMVVHTFFDGLAIVVSFAVDTQMGMVILIAVLLHKVPDGLTISSIILSLLHDKKKAFLAAVLLGVSTIAGGIFAFLFLGNGPHEQMETIAVALTAGIFLYVSGTDLMPAISDAKDRVASAFLFIGVLLYFVFHWGVQALFPGFH